MHSNDHDLITTGEVARILGVTPRTVRKWITEGLLATRRGPAHHSHNRIRRTDVEALVARGPR